MVEEEEVVEERKKKRREGQMEGLSRDAHAVAATTTDRDKTVNMYNRNRQ